VRGEGASGGSGVQESAALTSIAIGRLPLCDGCGWSFVLGYEGLRSFVLGYEGLRNFHALYQYMYTLITLNFSFVFEINIHTGRT
jgi:hypothetical protein